MLDAIARELHDAYRQRGLIEAPSRTLPALSVDDAHRIATSVRRLRIASGDEPAGYKLGFTNAAVRAQFAAPAQFAATVYRQTLLTENRIAASGLLGPRIEPEIVIGIGAGGAPEWAAFGFEIVQSHVAEWKFAYVDAIADFGLHAALAVGERRPIDAVGAERLAALRVVLRRNGEAVEYGAAADVDGGPLGAAAWLRADLLGRGSDLHPGDIISTGSTTRVPPIAAGEIWTIEATDGELAPLELTVT